MALHVKLPVDRFSHALGEKTDGTAWNHIESQNLFLVLEGNGDHGSLILSVVHATTTLESFDVAFYVDEAIRQKRRAQVVRLRHLPIFAVSKDLQLALIYRMPDSQARRIQFRFTVEVDCQRATRILQKRGMTIQEQLPDTARPGTGGSRPDTARSDARPSTSQTTSSYFPQSSQQQQPMSSTFPLPNSDIGNLSTRPASRTQGGHTASYNMLPPRTATRDETPASQVETLSRPSTSQLWRSQTQPFQHSFQVSYSGERRTERPSSASHMATLDAIRQAAAEHEGPVVDACRADHTNAAELPKQHGPSGDHVSHGLPVDSTDSNEKPFTAASRTSVSSALDLPPLQKPRLVRDESITSSNTRNASVSTGHPPSRPFSALPVAGGREETRVTQPSQTANSSLMHGRRQIGLTAAPLASMKPTPTANSVPRGGLLTERSANSTMSRVDSNQDAPHEVVSPPAATKAVSRLHENAAPTLPPRKQPEDDSVARAYSAIRSSSYDAVAESLDQYAMQTPEDRKAALDQFMIENLENPLFTTLCEDVENCWRRIALGL